VLNVLRVTYVLCDVGNNAWPVSHTANEVSASSVPLASARFSKM